ncbi:acyl-CoA dehydrogenase family protein [Rhodococcus sp. LB1]|uniref:acyl-CoA dehydrogenase family protein n=1 Tax=Rhodococcus sp. LB1 TaxID=1807499 RepID=UPI000B313F3A|nr:acyl-CoA dehydrogenase family protein [Rhodococcus sp. LB1]
MSVSHIEASDLDADTLAELASVASRFAQPNVSRVRTLRESGQSFDREVWTRFAELGWLGLLVPETLGGAGAGESAVAVVAEKLGAGAYPEPYAASSVVVSHLLSGLALAGCGNAQALLESVLDGTQLLSVAVPADGGPTVRNGRVRGRRDGAITVFDGVANWVPVAEADTFLVYAEAEAGPVLASLPRTADGMVLESSTLSDHTTVATIELSGVTVPTADLIGIGCDVDAALAEATDVALIATAAELIGVADRALTLALEFITSRSQFGKPIGSFQVLQHRAVDMYIQLRLARAALRSALSERTKSTTTVQRRRAAASSARARSCIAATTICRQAVQLHGAIGFTDEYDLGYYVNRMVALTAWLGGPDVHRQRYFDLLGGRPGNSRNGGSR